MRLFLAVEPSRVAREAFARTLSSVRTALGDDAAFVKWVTPERVHLTLHFIGDVPAAELDRLREVLGSKLPGPPFDVVLDGAGTFARRGSVAVIWMGVTGGAARLEGLHHELGRRLQRSGWEIEARPYAPHLTLGRGRPGRRGISNAAAWAVMPAILEPVAWRVTEVLLFSSETGGGGPHYTRQHTLPLAETREVFGSVASNR